jgi:hypothetical protein
MKIQQILGVAVAVASALVGGSLGAEALEAANAAPLSGVVSVSSSTAAVVASEVTQAAKPVPTTTARSDQLSRSTSRLV